MTIKESDIVFLNDGNRPYLIADWSDDRWLCYWHPDSHWVTLRMISKEYEKQH